VEKDKADVDSTHLRSIAARDLARKHGLETAEVKRIMDSFNTATGKCGGFVDFSGFRRAAAFLELSEVLLASAWEATTKTEAAPGAWVEELDMDAFVCWYAAETREAAKLPELSLRHARSPTPQTLTSLASLHGVSVQVMEKVRRCFEQFDSNRCGLFDYTQFKEGLQRNLPRVHRRYDLGESRVALFWQELGFSGTGHGEADFVAFTQWYLKYFDASADRLMVPLSAFYAPIEADAWA